MRAPQWCHTAWGGFPLLGTRSGSIDSIAAASGNCLRCGSDWLSTGVRRVRQSSRAWRAVSTGKQANNGQTAWAAAAANRAVAAAACRSSRKCQRLVARKSTWHGAAQPELVVDGFTVQDRVWAAGAGTWTRVLRDKLGNSLAQLCHPIPPLCSPFLHGQGRKSRLQSTRRHRTEQQQVEHARKQAAAKLNKAGTVFGVEAGWVAAA
jgi:hypothetical protein